MTDVKIKLPGLEYLAKYQLEKSVTQTNS